MLQTYRPLLTSWLDTYIRQRLFDEVIDPLADENWRVLLIDEVAHGIASTFATALTHAAANQPVEGAEVIYRKLSEIKTISVRTSSAVDVNKCIYPKLPIPTRAGGLERLFIQWADQDATIEALAKIHEYRHDFLQRPYLKADGMPAFYSPDFLVRTADKVFVVETKAQSALSDENVQRKQRAAISWCEQINSLPEERRDGREWHYVLLGEATAREWKAKNARVSELLEFARLRRTDDPAQGQLI
jgi:type III restriction enzyme